MLCNVCFKIYPLDAEDICFTCNKAVCGMCQYMNFGVPEERLFKYKLTVYCFKCFMRVKYPNS